MWISLIKFKKFKRGRTKFVIWYYLIFNWQKKSAQMFPLPKQLYSKQSMSRNQMAARKIACSSALPVGYSNLYLSAMLQHSFTTPLCFFSRCPLPFPWISNSNSEADSTQHPQIFPKSTWQLQQHFLMVQSLVDSSLASPLQQSTWSLQRSSGQQGSSTDPIKVFPFQTVTSGLCSWHQRTEQA